MAFHRHKWSLCYLVVSVLVWSTTRREFPPLSPRTGLTHCPASLCLENVLGFLIGAKFAHDGICRKSFPPFPVGPEALSLLARLGTLCQRSLAPGKRDSPEQSPRGARGMPAQPSPEGCISLAVWVPHAAFPAAAKWISRSRCLGHATQLLSSCLQDGWQQKKTPLSGLSWTLLPKAKLTCVGEAEHPKAAPWSTDQYSLGDSFKQPSLLQKGV